MIICCIRGRSNRMIYFKGDDVNNLAERYVLYHMQLEVGLV